MTAAKLVSTQADCKEM